MKEHFSSTLDSQEKHKETLMNTQNTDYDELNTVYEGRIKALYEQIAKICENLTTDAKNYDPERIQEFVNRNLAMERDQFYEKIAKELASLRNDKKLLEKNLEALRTQNQELADNLEKQMISHSTMENSAEKQELERKIRVLEEELKTTTERLENEIKFQEQKSRSQTIKYIDQASVAKRETKKIVDDLENTQNMLSAATSECRRLGSELEFAQNKIEKLELEIADCKNRLKSSEAEKVQNLKEIEFYKLRSEDFEKVTELARELQKERDELDKKLQSSQNEILNIKEELNENSVKRIIDKQKEKIDELSEIISERDAELNKAKRGVSETKATYEKIVTELHEEIKRIRDENHHNEYSKELEYQQEKSSMKSAFALEMAKQQEEMQKMLEDQLKETEEHFTAEKTELNTKIDEMKKGHEDHITEIEKNTLPLEKHYQIVENIKNEAKQEKDTEVEKLKNQNANQTKDFEHKIDEMQNSYKSKISELEQNTTETKKNYENKILELTKNKFDLEAEKTKLSKEIKKNNDEINTLNTNLTNLKGIYEEERKKKKENERNLIDEQAKLRELAGLIEKTEHDLGQKNVECENLKDEVEKWKEENKKNVTKYKSIEKDLHSIEENLTKQIEAKKSEIIDLNNTISEQQFEIANVHKILQETREKDSKLIENEVNDHLNTKKKLLETEEKIKKANIYIETLQKDLKNLEVERENCANKINELGLQNSELQKEITEMELKMENTDVTYRKNIEKTQEINSQCLKILSEKVLELNEFKRNLKENIANLKSFVNDYSNQIGNQIIEYYKKIITHKNFDFDSKINSLTNDFAQKLQTEQNSSNLAHTSKIVDISQKYEETISQKNAEIGHYQELVDELDKKTKEMQRDIEYLEQKFKNSEQEKLERDHVIKELNQKINDNIEGFDFDKRETERINNETIEKINQEKENEVKRVDNRHKEKFIKLYNEVEAIKGHTLNEMRKLLTDITNLKSMQQYESAQLSQVFSEKLANAETTILSERDKSDARQMEIDQLKSELDSVKHEYKNLQMEAEQKIKIMNKASMLDNEKYSKLKADRRKELDELQNQVKQLKVELVNKKSEVEDISTDRDILKKSMGYRPLAMSGAMTTMHGSQTYRPLVEAQRDTYENLPMAKAVRNMMQSTKKMKSEKSQLSASHIGRYIDRDLI